jgi:hypothetical protein
VLMSLGLLAAVACLARGLVKWNQDFTQRTRMGEFARKLAESESFWETGPQSFWETGPHGERWFPTSEAQFGLPLQDNKDGTFSIGGTDYRYRPILANGRRICFGGRDRAVIVIWDSHPLNSGAYLAMAADLSTFEVCESEVAAGMLRD